jgi:hypothetical protein
MIAQFLVIFLFILSVGALFALYAIKIAQHFRFLRLKDGKKPGTIGDFFTRNFKDKKDAERWKQSFLMFPLLFAIVLDEPREELNVLKAQIKKLNVSIYAVLALAMLVVVYASKAFPQGVF